MNYKILLISILLITFFSLCIQTETGISKEELKSLAEQYAKEQWLNLSRMHYSCKEAKFLANEKMLYQLGGSNVCTITVFLCHINDTSVEVCIEKGPWRMSDVMLNCITGEKEGPVAGMNLKPNRTLNCGSFVYS